MRVRRSTLALALAFALAACGGEEPTAPQPEPALDTFNLDGTWEMTAVGGERLPVSMDDTVTCDDGSGGRDTTVREWQSGFIVFDPDRADLQTLTGYECGGIGTFTETTADGPYTAREDSIFFNWTPNRRSFRRAEWVVDDSVFETVGGFRFEEKKG